MHYSESTSLHLTTAERAQPLQSISGIHDQPIHDDLDEHTHTPLSYVITEPDLRE